MNKDSQHKSTEAQQWPPISFEKHVWQQDGNQDATERIEEDVVKGESKGPFAKAVEGSGDSGSSSLGLNLIFCTTCANVLGASLKCSSDRY